MSARHFNGLLSEAAIHPFRPVPFWFWNDSRPEVLNPRSIREQLERLKKQGFGGVVCFNKPPAGFSREDYLGPRWFELIRAAGEAGRDMGLQIWVNDGYNFPPGDAAGRIEKIAPELKQYTLAYVQADIPGRRSYSLIFPDRERLVFLRLTPEAFQAGEPAEVLAPDTNPADLAIPGRNGRLWEVALQELTWGFPAFENPRASELFIQCTYEEYRKQAGDLFGHGLTGFFSDADARRVTAGTHQNRPDFRSYPCSPEFFKGFHRQFGYDLRPYLPYVFLLAGPGADQRRDYWEWNGRLYAAWFEKNYQWCHAHGLKYTYHGSDSGPFAREENASGSFCKRASYFSDARPHLVLATSDFPGTDHEQGDIKGNQHLNIAYSENRIQSPATKPSRAVVGRDLDRLFPEHRDRDNRTFGDIRARYARSVAELNGRAGAMCEAFAATNWGCRPVDLRLITAWQVTQGITFLVPHALHFGMRGATNYFAPPALSEGSSLWPAMKDFNDWAARVLCAGAMGRPVAPIAVLDPARSVWVDQTTGKALFCVCDLLTHSPYDYLIVDEESLLAADIRKGHIRRQACDFSVLILPDIVCLDKSVIDRINAFHAGGGKVIGVGRTVAELEFDHVIAIEDVAPFQLDIGAIRGRHPLREALEAHLTPDFVFRNKDGNEDFKVHFLHRRWEDESDVYMIANIEQTEAAIEGTARMAATGDVIVINPEDGSCSRPERMAMENGFLSLPMILAPGQVFFCRIVPAGGVPPADVKILPLSRDVREEEFMELPEDFDVQWAEPNILPLSRWEQSSDGRAPRPVLPFFRVEPSAGDCLLRFPFQVKEKIPAPRLCVPESLLRNGVELMTTARKLCPADAEKETFFSDPYRAWMLPECSTPGAYEIILRVARGCSLMDLESLPILLRGAFAVDLDIPDAVSSVPYRSTYFLQTHLPAQCQVMLSRRPTRLRAGCWTKQGHPFYSGQAVYSTRFTVMAADAKASRTLVLPRVESMAEVLLDGGSLGQRIWPPYEWRMPPLTPGSHELSIRVINTLANLMEEYRAPSGLWICPRWMTGS